MAEHLGKSPQCLTYHLNKLKRLSFVERIQSFPYSIYILTPLGRRIKENLGQSEGVKPFWRCHALITGFDIKNFGNFEWENRPKIPMRNWFYIEEKITDSIGEWKINVQSTGLLKIYCPEIYSENSGEAFGNLEDISSGIARAYAERYGMKIGLMKIIREGHKELVGSEKLAELLGHTDFKKFYVDQSDKTKNLEERQSENSIEQLLMMPDRIEKVEKAITETLTPAILELREQIVVHLDVEKKTGNALIEMSETLKDIRESLKK